MKWVWSHYWPFCLSACAFLVFGIFLDDMRWAVRGALIVLGLGVMEVLWALFFSYRRRKKAAAPKGQR